LIRPLPAIDRDNEAYWKGGERGELLIQRCLACSTYIHPPTGFCPACESRKTEYAPVSGRAIVTTFTVNHKQWMPDLPVPYVLALVTIAEQDDVRLVTNIVDCDPDNVHVGMKVKVRFEPSGDLWVPLFAPEGNAG
jgi:uncharacterized OB-fold protein